MTTEIAKNGFTAIDKLPGVVDSERYILGALIAFPASANDVFTRLRSQDFIDSGHQVLFAALARQHSAGGIDPSLLVAELRGHREFSGQSAAAYLLELAGEVATRVHVPREAAKIVDASKKRQLLSIGEMVVDAARNGHTSDEVFATLQADIWEYQRNRYGEPRYLGISAAELAAGKYELRYLIDGLLVEGQPGFLGGPKKSLKTSLAMDLALSLATGGCFLGKFRVNVRRRVVFLSGESGLATLQETAQRVCNAMGIALDSVDGFTLTTTLPRLNDPADLVECERFLADHEAEVAIADPLYLMLTGDDAGNLFKQGALLRAWSESCQSIGVTGLLCHHTKSTVADPYAPAELDHLAWSGCAEFARQWLLVSRREQYEPGTGFHRLWLTAGGSAGHSGLWAVDVNEGTQSAIDGRQWSVGVESAVEARATTAERKARDAEQRQLEQLAFDRTAVCNALAGYPEGMTKTGLRDRAGISGRRWPAVLAAMLDSRDLVECDVVVGNHKRASTGYKLNTAEPV